MNWKNLIALILVSVAGAFARADACSNRFEEDILGIDLAEALIRSPVQDLARPVRVLEGPDFSAAGLESLLRLNVNSAFTLDIHPNTTAHELRSVMNQAVASDITVVLTALDTTDNELLTQNLWALKRFSRYGTLVTTVGNSRTLSELEFITAAASSETLLGTLNPDVVVPTRAGNETAATILGSALGYVRSQIWGLSTANIKRLLQVSSIPSSRSGVRILNFYRLFEKTNRLRHASTSQKRDLLNSHFEFTPGAIDKKELKQLTKQVQGLKSCEPQLFEQLRRRYFDTLDPALKGLLAQAYERAGHIHIADFFRSI